MVTLCLLTVVVCFLCWKANRFQTGGQLSCISGCSVYRNFWFIIPIKTLLTIILVLVSLLWSWSNRFKANSQLRCGLTSWLLPFHDCGANSPFPGMFNVFLCQRVQGMKAAYSELLVSYVCVYTVYWFLLCSANAKTVVTNYFQKWVLISSQELMWLLAEKGNCLSVSTLFRLHMCFSDIIGCQNGKFLDLPC